MDIFWWGITLTYIRTALSELTEIDKARAVSERAVKTINFREEQEKFNVWVKVAEAAILWGTPLVAGGLLYLLWASKQIPGVH